MGIFAPFFQKTIIYADDHLCGLKTQSFWKTLIFDTDCFRSFCSTFEQTKQKNSLRSVGHIWKAKKNRQTPDSLRSVGHICKSKHWIFVFDHLFFENFVRSSNCTVFSNCVQALHSKVLSSQCHHLTCFHKKKRSFLRTIILSFALFRNDHLCGWSFMRTIIYAGWKQGRKKRKTIIYAGDQITGKWL